MKSNAKKHVKNPYYIVAPAYTGKSAGISLLYKLCHLLNTKGCRAFIVVEGMQGDVEAEYPIKYQTPFLSLYEATQHIQQGFNPILIRAEVGRENLKYPCTFRYILNYIGHFPGEPKETDPEFQIDKKYFWAFSTDIAKKHNIPYDRIMFTPIVDTEVFYPPQVENRQGKACYLGKYAEIYSKQLPKEIDKSFYVFYRSKNIGNTPQREKYSEKLRNTQFLYVYENTSVITEALMCGCPVVCVPNPYCQFSEKDMIGFHEVGLNGIAIGTNSQELERAKATVHLARQKVLELMNNYDGKIDYFIEETQKISWETKIDKVVAMQAIIARLSPAPKKQNKLIRELKRFVLSINPFKVPYALQSLLRRLR